MRTIWYFAAIALIAVTACSKPTILGSDIFGDDQANLLFTDTFTINATTVRTDTVIRSFPAPTLYRYYTVGNMTEPVFGLVDAQTYAQFAYSATSIPTFEDSYLFDSLVLTLPYLANGCSGDLSQDFNMQVHLLNELMPDSIDIYSNKHFGYDPTALADVTFRPAVKDSITFNVDEDTYYKRAPALRIHLPQSLGEYIMAQDTAAFSDPYNFLSFFKGVVLKSGQPTAALLSFAFDHTDCGINLYYRKSALDTVSQSLFFRPYVRNTATKHDYTGTPVQAALENNNLNDSLLYVQGLVGSDIRIDIPYVRNFRDTIIVNKAELEVYIDPSSTTNLYEPILQLVITENDVKDSLIIINDAGFGIGNNFSVFGGKPTDVTIAGQTVKKYTFNISEYFQHVVDGEEETHFYITAHLRQEVARRVVLCGPRHANFPMKLNLFYTVRP